MLESESHSRVRDTSSNESLERIHTFALKSSFQQNSSGLKPEVTPYYDSALKEGEQVQVKIMAKGEIIGRTVKPLLLDMISSTKNNYKTDDEEEVTQIKTTTTTSKAFYVEESVKILQGIIQQADPILTELVSKVKQFERYTTR